MQNEIRKQVHIEKDFMALIEIWLTADNGKVLNRDLRELYKDFSWNTESVPIVGDDVSINLKSLSHLDWADDIGWIDGKVVRREFKACSDVIELTLDVERKLAQRLARILIDCPPSNGI